MRYLLIFDNPDLDERLELAPTDEKVAYLRQVTNQDREIVRYAVVNSGVTGKAGQWFKQDLFLLKLMAQIAADYNENRDQEDERGGEQRDS